MSHHEEHENQGQTPNPVQIQRFLGGIDYPVDKQTLVENARNQGADDMVMQALERLPDQEYDSPTDISEQIGNS